MILIIGNFPPPYTGANLCTQFFAELHSNNSERFDFSQIQSFKTVSGFIRLAQKTACCVGRIALRRRSYSACYLQSYAGEAMVFQLPILLVCRLFGIEAFIHFHSGIHFGNRHILTRLALFCAGPSANAIVQQPSFKHALATLYDHSKVEVIPNIGLMSMPMQIRRPSTVKQPRIGLLSNLTEEKGILRLADVAAHLQTSFGIVSTVITAGPFESPSLQAHFITLLERESIVYENLGFVSREAISGFFDRIDVLVMLTAYPVEAEPLVVYEAAMHGVPSVVGCVGATSEQVALIGAGAVVESYDVGNAAQIIAEWCENGFPEIDAQRLERTRQQALKTAQKMFSTDSDVSLTGKG